MEGVPNPAAVRSPDKQLYLFPCLVGRGNHSRIGIARSALEATIGPVLKSVFPFEDTRCERIADNVLRGLNLISESREPFPTDRI